MTAQTQEFLNRCRIRKELRDRRSEDRHGLISQAYLTVTKRKTIEQRKSFRMDKMKRVTEGDIQELTLIPMQGLATLQTFQTFPVFSELTQTTIMTSQNHSETLIRDDKLANKMELNSADTSESGSI